MNPPTSTDRLLVLAPHPDDEALACGGLIQRAFAAGAKVRVIFATSGDNNPWPQRFVENRWQMMPNDRARWGARRREESRRAIELLGGTRDMARFLNFPDQGLTRLLMVASELVMAELTAELVNWQPTLIVGPALGDRHADHSALHVLLRLSLAASRISGYAIHDYLVHPGIGKTLRRGRGLALTAREVKCKLAAILCHETQMILSRGRFTAYAQSEEWYQSTAAEQLSGSSELGGTSVCRNGIVRLILHGRKPIRSQGQLLIVGLDTEGKTVCWSIVLPKTSGLVHLQDERTAAIFHRATVRYERDAMEVALPARGISTSARIYIRLPSQSLFPRSPGWSEVCPQLAVSPPQ